jgi:chemotaxis protein CheC
MNIEGLFTERQIDLLQEALNIGAGNAVTALSQILQCDTDMSFPLLQSYSPPLKADIFQNIGDNCIAVEMGIVGELRGGLVVIIPQQDENKLTDLIRHAKDEQRGEGIPDLSIILELSNILAGAFLTAIHDFCGLNIFHTLPNSENGNCKSLVELLQQSLNGANDIVLVITNQFTVNKSNIKADLLVVLSPDDINMLVRAIENTRAEQFPST